jgi:putative addiction module component (TIGR02574 family)
MYSEYMNPRISMSSETVVNAALALPEEERAMLAERLLESLPATGDVTDDDLAAELERRRADVTGGTAEAVPWSQLRREA